MNGTGKQNGATVAPAVVITGATQGIGRALAEEFARDGHTLVLVARDETKLAATARSLTEAHGIGVKLFACDLGTTGGLRRSWKTRCGASASTPTSSSTMPR